jgi:hypothetical protein
VDKVDGSTAAAELKQYVREKLRTLHRERRQPHVDLLNRLQMQQRGRPSFAA